MNKFVKSMMLAVVSLMAIAFFTACDKEMVNDSLEVKDKTNTFSSLKASHKEEYYRVINSYRKAGGCKVYSL